MLIYEVSGHRCKGLKMLRREYPIINAHLSALFNLKVNDSFVLGRIIVKKLNE